MSRVAIAGTVAFFLAAINTAIGSFKEETGLFDWELTQSKVSEYLLALLVILVVTFLVFRFAVASGLRRGRPGITGLVLSVLGLFSIIVFWSGMPSILGTSGVFLGSEARKTGANKGQATGALTLGALAILAAIYLALTG